MLDMRILRQKMQQGSDKGDSMDVNDLLELALEETKELDPGEVFLVKDLFKGYIWNRIPVRDRLLLGTLFLNHVHRNPGTLEITDKSSSHQQKYRKI